MAVLMHYNLPFEDVRNSQIILDLEWDTVPDKTDNVRDSKVISSLNLSIYTISK